MDGFALSVSIGLQYGVPLKALVDKFINTRFEPAGYTGHPAIPYAKSVLDYIARWLGGRFISADYLTHMVIARCRLQSRWRDSHVTRVGRDGP